MQVDLSTYWPTLICGLAASGLLWAELVKNRRAQWLFKPFAAMMFVLQAIGLGAFASTYGLTILIALTLCAAGDVLLIPRDRARLFMAGMAAFALGHVGYIVAFTLSGIDVPPAFLRLAVIIIFVGLGALAWLRRHVPADMVIPVTGYTFIIIAMVVSAAGAVYSGAGQMVLLAAIMFAVSDMAVARDRFIKPQPINAVLITPLYFGAQLLFASSV
jgi:uncharacterized membrane protein YhhN